MEILTQTVEEARRAQMLRQLQLCDHNLSGILKNKFIEMIITEYKVCLYLEMYLSFLTCRTVTVLENN